VPELQRFNFAGGLALTTERRDDRTGDLHRAFIAEVIRAGIWRCCAVG
jgi:ABC-type amino acid transport system permease subunit